MTTPMYVYCHRCKLHHRTGRPSPHAVPLPRYTGAIIPACPRCGSDLEDEGPSFWCGACRESVPPNAAMHIDDRYPDD